MSQSVKLHNVEGLRNREVWLSSESDFSAGEIKPTSQLSHIVIFVPGNPGVFSAYREWLEHLCSRLGKTGLVIFSGHLGHYSTSDPCLQFSCIENCSHHAGRILSILKQLSELQNCPKILLVGHSVGAYFLQRASSEIYTHLNTSNPRLMSGFHEKINLLFLCGTFCQFGPSGRLKTLFAATQFGQSAIRWLLQTGLADRVVKRNDKLAEMRDEFTPNFLSHMCSLAADEMNALPSSDGVFKDLAELQFPSFYAFASNDSYVPKDLQLKFVEQYGDKVYCSETWWHAFALRQPGAGECSDLIQSILETGRFDSDRNKVMECLNSWKYESLKFDIWSKACSLILYSISTSQSFLASISDAIFASAQEIPIASAFKSTFPFKRAFHDNAKTGDNDNKTPSDHGLDKVGEDEVLTECPSAQ